MVQVIYEYLESWPENGSLQVEIPPVHVEVSVSPDAARRRANGYLVTLVSMMLHATDPMLILGERPIWRLSMEMRLHKLGPVATLGTIEVDATTGTVFSFTAEQIRAIQDRANAIVTRLTPAAAPAV
jgi:hypothetical protein